MAFWGIPMVPNCPTVPAYGATLGHRSSRTNGGTRVHLSGLTPQRYVARLSVAELALLGRLLCQ